ncbi:MAG: ABC transporter permease [Lachnospiraceae bacterium]|nr:ABC transporter permease [Lachnospiraceae bacterium]
MLFWENVVLALNSLKSNKMRALLTMLGIIIGIGSVIAIFTVGNSVTLSVSTNLQDVGANDVYVSVVEKTEDEADKDAPLDGLKFGTFQSSEEMEEEDYITVDMIHDLCEEYKDDIYAVSCSQNLSTADVSVEGNDASVTVIGTNVGYFIPNKVEMTAGTMFNSSDFEEGRMVCMVDEKFVDDLFDGDYEGAIGKDIDFLLEDQAVSLTIAGVYHNESQYATMFNFNTGTNLYIPINAAKRIQRSPLRFSTIEVVASVGVDTSALAKKITKFFDRYYAANGSFEISAYTFTSLVNMLDSILNTVTSAISLIAAIALVVGGIGVMNIMLVSVTERTREIGTRKALGAKNSSIRAQFLVEAIIICLIGGVIGLALGITGGMALTNYMGYPAAPSIGGILLSIGFSVTIGLVFGYVPANKAAKMNPIDALRYE